MKPDLNALRPRRAWRRGAAGSLRVGLALLLALVGSVIAVPTAQAAATGSFSTFEYLMTTDGVELGASNPFDHSATNGIVAVNDVVGLKIHAVSQTSAVDEAKVVLTKPSCFI